MFKTKLLILLLVSIQLISCTNIKKKNDLLLSVGYIGGGYQGLQLSNQLKAYLSNFGMLDENSQFEVKASISHSQNVFITNIDNTSDREQINSSINLEIYDKNLDCLVYTFNEDTSQFYVLASSDKFMSNKAASQKIVEENTEYFVKKFMTNLSLDKLTCKLLPYELRLNKLKKSIYEK